MILGGPFSDVSLEETDLLFVSRIKKRIECTQSLLLTRAPPRIRARPATDLLGFSILSLGNGSGPAARTYIVRKISAAAACNLHFRSHTRSYNAPKTTTAAGRGRVERRAGSGAPQRTARRCSHQVF